MVSCALWECVEKVLDEMLGSKGVDCREIALSMLTAWSVKGTIPRLDLGGKITISAARRKEIEDKVLQKIQLHVLLSHFEQAHCEAFFRDSIGFTYDGIVREVNADHLEPVLEYPSLRPGMEALKVEEIKEQRFQVEEAIKLWFRQLRRPDMKRLPEFTNDEAWLEMLYGWSNKQDCWRQDCLIIPSTAPDCHYKFEHMKKFQTDWSSRNKKHYLKYCHLLEKWPIRFWDFSWALKKIGSMKEGTSQFCMGQPCYNRDTWYASNNKNSFYI